MTSQPRHSPRPNIIVSHLQHLNVMIYPFFSATTICRRLIPTGNNSLDLLLQQGKLRKSMSMVDLDSFKSIFSSHGDEDGDSNW